MKLRRMAVVAAAAVVGPTVLTATPAMAQDNPAVTVPDTAPKDDSAPVTEEPEAPVTETPEDEAPVTQPPAEEDPAAPAPAPAPGKPAVEKPAEQAPPNSTKDFREGPAIYASGIPDSFEPGGAPGDFTVAVGNTGLGRVTDYVPAVGISDAQGKLKASQITAEVRGADGTWKPVALRLDRGPGVFEFELGSRTVEAEQVFRTDVRVSFAADAPQVQLEIYVLGEGRDAEGQVLSAASWYDTAIGSGEDGGGDGGDEDPVYVEGPDVSLEGVPAGGFTAGGDWHEMTLHVDNTGIGDVDEYTLAMNIGRGPGQGAWLKSTQIQLEAYGLDENDQEGWYPVDIEGSEEMHGGAIGTVSLEAGEKTDIQLRMRFTKDTAAGPVSLSTFGWAPESESGEWMSSEPHTYRTKIDAAGTQPGGGEDDDTNEPAPQGGTGTVVDGGGSGAQLAETGTDAATSWALGGAGIAVAMGAALVAGTGRHRRPSAVQ